MAVWGSSSFSNRLAVMAFTRRLTRRSGCGALIGFCAQRSDYHNHVELTIKGLRRGKGTCSGQNEREDTY